MGPEYHCTRLMLGALHGDATVSAASAYVAFGTVVGLSGRTRQPLTRKPKQDPAVVSEAKRREDAER
jgi:hypothetical protein